MYSSTQFVGTTAHEALRSIRSQNIFLKDGGCRPAANCHPASGGGEFAGAGRTFRTNLFHFWSGEVGQFADSRSDGHGKQLGNRREDRNFDRHYRHLYASGGRSGEVSVAHRNSRLLARHTGSFSGGSNGP